MKVYMKLVMIMKSDVIFTTSKNLILESTMFLRHNVRKYTWNSLDGKMHNSIHHVLTDKRWHSNIVEV